MLVATESISRSAGMTKSSKLVGYDSSTGVAFSRQVPRQGVIDLRLGEVVFVSGEAEPLLSTVSSSRLVLPSSLFLRLFRLVTSSSFVEDILSCVSIARMKVKTMLS